MTTIKEIADLMLKMSVDERKKFIVLDVKYNAKEWKKYFRDKL